MSVFSWLEEALPPIFPGKDLDRLTGNVLRWRTIQNRRCRREIPEDCFSKISARKIVIHRDAFIAWLYAEQNHLEVNQQLSNIGE